MASIDMSSPEKRNIVSMRLNDHDRIAIRRLASRMLVRESELYRFAIRHLLNRLHKLHSMDCAGSDLLPLLIDFREELSQHLGIKKQQLFKIVNGGNAHPDKFVAMSDIELLLLPQHTVRLRLSQTDEAALHKQNDTGSWLKRYFAHKYQLPIQENADSDEISGPDLTETSPGYN